MDTWWRDLAIDGDIEGCILTCWTILQDNLGVLKLVLVLQPAAGSWKLDRKNHVSAVVPVLDAVVIVFSGHLELHGRDAPGQVAPGVPVDDRLVALIADPLQAVDQFGHLVHQELKVLATTAANNVGEPVDLPGNEISFKLTGHVLLLGCPGYRVPALRAIADTLTG